VQLTSFKIKKEEYLAEAVDDADVTGGVSMPMPSTYPGRRGGEGGYGTPVNSEMEQTKTWTLRRYDFLIQFCWQPTPRGKRLDNMADDAGGGGEVPSTAAVPDDTASDSS
jgi:hypothetical protein